MGGLKAGEARELLGSTGPNAFFSARLVIGEWLHDGQYCFLTNEQHWDLITDFDITDPASHRLLLSTIVEIDEGYGIYAEMYRANGPIGQHKRNLKDLSKLAGRLLPLLEAEPLLWHFADYRWNVDIDALLDGLLKVRKAAKELSKDETYLRSVRVADPPRARSLERVYIWEPALRLWIKLGRPLGYRRDGPIIRILRMLHHGLGLQPPKPGAIRQAVNDQVGRIRTAKRAR